MIYLDNAATTKPIPQAVEALLEAVTESFGNPSSLHGAGMAAAAILKRARESVAAALGADSGEVYFTSGGTEADNWAVFSGARANRHVGRHIVTTAVEHHAVLNAVKQLEASGHSVTYISPDAQGCISAQAVLEALRPDTSLVTVMMVGSESGAVFPIAEIAQGMKRLKHPALLHTDAVQGLFKVPFSAKKLGADLISVSAHKIGGVKGAGALYVRKGLHLPPLLLGGGQESGGRSGTEAVPAIAAFGAACVRSREEVAAGIEKMAALRDLAVARLRAEIPECVIYGPLQAPHIIPVALPGCPAQVLVNALAQEEICVSAGSACSKGKRSHVLTAQGLPPAVIDSAIRASLCPDNTESDIEALVQALARAWVRIGGRRG